MFFEIMYIKPLAKDLTHNMFLINDHVVIISVDILGPLQLEPCFQFMYNYLGTQISILILHNLCQ